MRKNCQFPPSKTSKNSVELWTFQSQDFLKYSKNQKASNHHTIQTGKLHNQWYLHFSTSLQFFKIISTSSQQNKCESIKVKCWKTLFFDKVSMIYHSLIILINEYFLYRTKGQSEINNFCPPLASMLDF